MYECVDCLLDFALDEGQLVGADFFRCNGCLINIEVDIALAQEADEPDEDDSEPFSTSRFLQEHGDDEADFYSEEITYRRRTSDFKGAWR